MWLIDWLKNLFGKKEVEQNEVKTGVATRKPEPVHRSDYQAKVARMKASERANRQAHRDAVKRKQEAAHARAVARRNKKKLLAAKVEVAKNDKSL